MYIKSKILLMIILTIKCKYYILTNNPQNLKNDFNYGIIGGSLNLLLNLNDEFMVTFWFRFQDLNVDIFPFFSLYSNNNLWKDINLYKLNYILSDIENIINININLNVSYFLKLEGKIENNFLIIKIYIFNDINNFFLQKITISKLIDINSLIFIINRHNLRENILIEKLIFYNKINEYNNQELINGVSNILYFINFRNNFFNSKYFKNEIKNEFGPSLNGNIDFKYSEMIISDFNENTKEIEWHTSSYNNFIYFGKHLLSYINWFKLSQSYHIFLKIDFYLNKINNSIENTFLEIKIENNFSIFLKINIDILKNTQALFQLQYSNNVNKNFFDKTISDNKLIDNKKLLNKSYLGLEFVYIGIKKNFSSNFNINILTKFKNNSYFCDVNDCLFISDFSDINLTINTNLSIYYKNLNIYNFIFLVYFKEFIIGLGIPKIKNDTLNNILIIENSHIINPFILYNNNFTNLERRNSFNLIENHKLCNINNCSICRNNLNLCEFCYKNYYLLDNSCILNTNSNKFVNNYSILKNKILKKNNYNKINNIYYKIYFSVEMFSRYYLFDFNFKFKNNLPKDINLLIGSTNCQYFWLDYVSNTANNVIFNWTIPFNSHSCINEISIRNYNNKNNNNDLINFELNINKEDLTCNRNYNNISCEIACSNSNYYSLFDKNNLYYKNCKNENLLYYVKNDFFKYYNDCPVNCLSCQIVNDLISCTSCKIGFRLKNNECILNLLLDCSINNTYMIDFNNKKLHICNNLCDITNNNEINYIINYHNNNNVCQDTDIIVLKCINNIKFYDFYNNICKGCFDNNCYTQNCNNCKDINNIIPCSDGFIFFKNKCIQTINFDLSCLEYGFNNICNRCMKNYILYPNNKCFLRNVTNCNVYFEKSIMCKICEEGYFINNNNCNKCNSNCKLCEDNANKCTSCLFNYNLNNKNICVFNDIYSKNCLNLNSLFICTKCIEGFFLTSNYICDICNNNCLTCINNSNNCLTCKHNYILKDNICFKKIKNCNIMDTNNIFNCTKCFSSFYFNTRNNKCIKCNNNCLSCKLNKNNCINCNINGVIVKNQDNKYKFCKYPCKIDKIIEYNNTKIKYFKIYNFYEKLKYLNYFIILPIPNNIEEKHIKKDQIIRNILILFNNVSISKIISIDYYYKKLLIIPEKLNIALKSIKSTLIVKSNIFKDNKLCFYKQYRYKININNTKFLLNNEIKENNKINFPIFNEDSKEFKDINSYKDTIKNTTNIIIIQSLIISLISPTILAKLSIFFNTLIYLKFLTLLKVNWGLKINTWLVLLDFNINTIDTSKYLNLSLTDINKKIYRLVNKIPKIYNLKIIFINNLSLNYTLLLIGIFIYVIYFFFKFLNNLIKLIKHLKNKKKIIITLRSNFSYQLRYIKYNKIFIKLQLFKKKFINFFNLYFVTIMITELPNIIFITIAYFSTLNILEYNFTQFFIIIILIVNITIITMFIYNFYLAVNYVILDNEYNKNFIDKLILLFIPYLNDTKDNLDYMKKIFFFKIIEVIRLSITFLIILYINTSIILEIILLIFIQIIFLIYICLIYEKNMILCLLLIKEILILTYLISILIVVIFKINHIIEICIIINLSVIFIIAIIEFSYKNIIKIMKYVRQIYDKIKKKKKINIKINNTNFVLINKKNKIKDLKNLKVKNNS